MVEGFGAYVLVLYRMLSVNQNLGMRVSVFTWQMRAEELVSTLNEKRFWDTWNKLSNHRL